MKNVVFRSMVSDATLNFCNSIIIAGDKFNERSLDFLCSKAPSKAFGLNERILDSPRSRAFGRRLFGPGTIYKTWKCQNESAGPFARKRRSSVSQAWTKARVLRLAVTSPVIALLSLLSTGWIKSFNTLSASAREQACIAVHAPGATTFRAHPDGSFLRAWGAHDPQLQPGRPAAATRARSAAPAPAPAPRRAHVAEASAVADAPLWNGRRAPPRRRENGRDGGERSEHPARAGPLRPAAARHMARERGATAPGREGEGGGRRRGERRQSGQGRGRG